MKKILLSSIVAIALLTGCGEDKKVAETKVVAEPKQEVVTPQVKVEEKAPEAKLVEQVKESASVVANKVVEESKKVAEAVPAAVDSVTDKVAEKAQEMTTSVVETATETKEKIEETINTVVEAKTEEQAQVDTAALVEKGKGLFAKCSACHGQSAEKAALGKSQIIKGWDASKVVEALKGYKDDTYGGVMKGVMKGQVASLSDEDMEALGAYINTL